MNPLIVSQCALDDGFVAPDDRAEIGKCNMRIVPTKTQKEATYQVVLDTLTLSLLQCFLNYYRYPDAALELAKSISRTEAEEQEAARLVHETYERLVTKKSTRTRNQTERLTADTKKAIKASKLATGPQQTAGSSEGASLMPEVIDEPTVDTRAHDDSEDSWEDDNHDDQSIDIEEIDDDELTKSDNEDQATDDAEKNDEDKVEEEKDTNQEPALDEQANDNQVGVLTFKIHKEKPTLFVSTSSHSVSSNYDNQFLVSSLERSLLAPFLDVLASVVPPTPTTPTPPPILITTITTTKAPTSTYVNPESETLSALQLIVSDLEKEVKELKQADHSTTLHALIRSKVPSAINEYLGSILGDALQKEIQKHTEKLRQEYSQKSTLEIRNIKMEHVEKQQKS
ncbi:hypothetical protein Tco_0570268 [Tanacetum coccineum]